ncbi:hypothetical protein FRC02_004349 [Tulasnella sp. 418]|nr:hypothetical protein FRC02_004349 [Tulasnella sp. 418]
MSANSRIGPTDRPHRAAATTSPANNPPTQSQPAGHAESSESPAPSATPTVAESDDTERTLAAALPLPHALSPVHRPNPPPRNGIES